MKEKVIIIGAGIGGLATALRLLIAGYEVVIYEKEDKVYLFPTGISLPPFCFCSGAWALLESWYGGGSHWHSGRFHWGTAPGSENLFADAGLVCLDCDHYRGKPAH